MKTNQDCSCGNVYVNYCCPDGNGGASFLGTKVYVDSRNTNESPDGSVNNPFATLEDAFAYVDSTDEDYVVNIINADISLSLIEYTFTKKGNLALVGDLTYNIQENDYLRLSLRFQDEESVFCVNGLRADLTVYGGQGVHLNDILSPRIRLYDTLMFVRLNNCRYQQGASSLILGYENAPIPDEMVTLGTLLITNSSLSIDVNRKIYYAWATNSYIPMVSGYLQNVENYPLVHFMFYGCFIGLIENVRALSDATFEIESSILSEISNFDTDRFYVKNGDMFLDYNLKVTNYTPDKNTLFAYLEAIDKKLGEHQARIDSL